MARSSETQAPLYRRSASILVVGAVLGLTVAYPFAVWAAVRHVDARWIGGIVAAALAIRGVLLLRPADPALRRRMLYPPIAVGVLVAVAIVTDDGRAFFFLPVLINGAFALAFARTLYSGPSMAESFARLHASDLTPLQVRYCWRVTAFWVVFFVANGGLTAWLAIAGLEAWWALWTGLLSYVTLGSAFALEMTYRYWRYRRYDGAVSDRFFRRLFPPWEPEDPSKRAASGRRPVR